MLVGQSRSLSPVSTQQQDLSWLPAPSQRLGWAVPDVQTPAPSWKAAGPAEEEVEATGLFKNLSH